MQSVTAADLTEAPTDAEVEETHAQIPELLDFTGIHEMHGFFGYPVQDVALQQTSR